jgi:hypothetical protein
MRADLEKPPDPLRRERRLAGNETPNLESIESINSNNIIDRNAVATQEAPPVRAWEKRLVRHRLCERLHSLGARVVFELLDEIGRANGIENDVWERLRGYSELRPEILALVGGNKFPPAPLHLVEGSAHG